MSACWSARLLPLLFVGAWPGASAAPMAGQAPPELRPAARPPTDRAIPHNQKFVPALPRQRTDGVSAAAADAGDGATAAIPDAGPDPASAEVASQRPYRHRILGGILAWTMRLLAIAAVALMLVKSGLLCLAVRHRRSRKGAKFSEEEQCWFSRCTRCGASLVRDSSGTWSRPTGRRATRIPLPAQVAESPATGKEKRVAAVPMFRPGRSAGPLPSRPSTAPNPAFRPLPDQGINQRARTIVSELLKDVLDGLMAPPGAKGALFFMVDELRATQGMDGQAQIAEQISIRVQQLECALQRGDRNQATLARDALEELAGQWSDELQTEET